MTDMLKEAESTVIDVIINKTTTKAKATKTNTKTKPTIQLKIKTTRKDTVKEKTIPNEYLKMCNAKQEKNHEKVASIAEEMKELKQARKTPTKKKTTRISIKIAEKRKEIDSGKKKCKIDHSDAGMLKEETDRRYCKEIRVL